MRSSGLTYRADIDGLRAVAVITVIAFHAFPAAAPGGFIGVDVFFVISGFLISSIIFEAIDAHHFSFAEFYARRVLRIFPALFVVLAFCLLMGWLFLPPYLLAGLGRESAAGALFGANFLFWNEAGYFNAEAASKPLLHLWSLGVEEQFYLLWPALLYLCARVRLSRLVAILAAGTASYLLSRHAARVTPIGAFYLPQYRFWELMLGSLYAHPLLQSLSRSFPGNIRSIFWLIGIALIGYAVFGSAGHETSGRFVLASTMGAALVIANPEGWLNQKVLSRGPAVFIGKISYPLYLWHWPLLWLYRWTGWHFALGEAAVIGLSLVFSALTYAFIEQPLRARKDHRQTLLNISRNFVAAMVAVAAFSTASTIQKGFPDREIISLSFLPEPQAKLEAQIMRVYETRYDFGFADLYGDKPCFRYKEAQTVEMFLKNGCTDPEFAGRPSVFILGDSHAASLSIGLKPLLASKHINFERVTYGWCEPTDDRRDQTCDDLNTTALGKISELKPDILIVNAYWVAASMGDYFHGAGDYMNVLLALMDDLKQRGAKHIIVVGQMPTYNHSLPERLVEDYVRKALPIPRRVGSAQTVSLAMDTRMRNLPYQDGAVYVSLRDALCNDDGCLAFVGPDVATGILLWDYGHLTAVGSDYVARITLEPIITRILSNTKPNPD